MKPGVFSDAEFGGESSQRPLVRERWLDNGVANFCWCDSVTIAVVTPFTPWKTINASLRADFPAVELYQTAF